MYRKVAETLADKVKSTWSTEDSLKAEFTRNFPSMEPDRTSHWGAIVSNLLEESWGVSGPEVKSKTVSYDRCEILKHLHSILDYNLFTQVLLNLQNYGTFAYRVADAENDVSLLKSSWPKESKLNPFAPKSKMIKTASTEEEQKYNVVLSTMRSVKIIAGITPLVSSRVSPMGSTPALTDSQNISMLGIGADKYLTTKPGLKPYYICWQPGSSPEMTEMLPNASAKAESPSFRVEDIPYIFTSKSGGDILNEVLFSRRLMYEIFGGIDTGQTPLTMVPRMNSILVITEQDGVELRMIFDELKEKYPMLELVEGSRA